MGIEYPYATGGALVAPLPGPRFDDCVIIFRSILLCKVPYSILILTDAGARGPTKENAYRFSSLAECTDLAGTWADTQLLQPPHLAL